MAIVVLRCAASLQSWSGYRHLAKLDSVVPTAGLPRKSGITGLLGAALGPHDSGFGSARDLASLGRAFDMHVRVDTRNPAAEDFQVVGPLPELATQVAERSLQFATASTSKFPAKRGGGNFQTEVTRRDFLPHSEFLVALETESATAAAWLKALREPVFMPYLGRRSCAPAFPFVLGQHDGTVTELFEQCPWTDRYGSDEALFGYAVSGDYNTHHAEPHQLVYQPPSNTRKVQLAWAKENLR